MLTVLQAINLSTEYLEKKGIESSRLNAELLLASILTCKRFDLYLKFDQPLKENEISLYREYIARRGKFEPLQYITCEVEFYGLNFKVSSAVLIPRPETEILVELIINKYKDKPGLTVLDIGTGSGNIPVALAKNLPGSKIVTIDISEEALIVAKQNAELNGVTENIEFIQQDIFNNSFPNNFHFDLIVSNPPYVEKNEYGNLQEEIVNYEPRIAVTDEGDGYSFYKRIVEISKIHLKPGGELYFEMAKGQSNQITSILESSGLKEIKIIKDYLQIERVICGEKI